MSQQDAVDEFLLTFFLDEDSQNYLDPDDLSNYHPDDVSQVFVPEQKICITE